MFQGEPAFGLNQFAQRPARQVGHCYRQLAVDLLNIIDFDNGRMIQRRDGPGFPFKAAGKGRIEIEMGMKQLERHQSSQAGIPGLVDYPKAAPS